MGSIGYMKHRFDITMDKELSALRAVFDSVEDRRAKNSSYSLPDILMSGFAMFNLKYASLLEFEQQSRTERMNLKNIYGIDKICSDVQLRRVLNTIDPDFMRGLFVKQFGKLKTTGLLKRYAYSIGGSSYLIVSCDGVQHFSSKTLSCPCCLEKKHRDGSMTFHHQMLCAALVHPARREVFILHTEPIIQQDGVLKNDCERNAAQRLQKQMKSDYGAYQNEHRFLFVEDALYANAPHIQKLQLNNFHFLLNVKPDGHKTLFAQIQGKEDRKQLTTHTKMKDGATHHFEYANNALLCNSAPDVRVNFIRYRQTDKKGKTTTFSWITDIKVSAVRLFNLMKAARARWKIENETFNTLKNLGYRFEHNFGHGNDHLSAMFAYLMLYAFYVDQLIQICCPIFAAIEKNIQTKIKLWTCIKAQFMAAVCASMEFIYRTIAKEFDVQLQ